MHHDVADEHKWLFNKHSKKLMSFRLQYGILTEKGQKFSLLQKLKWSFALGFKVHTFLKAKPEAIINALETAYYISRKREIENELCTIETSLKSINIQQRVKELRQLSLKTLKNTIAKRFTGERKRFTIKTIKPQTETFLKEYPVVLSTTYSAKACISKDMVFDYLIMDEASQVDIKTGALALSCAINAVIVGDDKQLPNVVSHVEEQALQAIQSTYNVDEKYQATQNSFLQSCAKVFTDAPITLLREHYRCHPRIIDFCNQRFYNGELIAMTSDSNEDKVLQVIKTVPGNHARGHYNQREIDVIVQEVMPEYSTSETIGIITPYRDQATAINRALGNDVASTVHKFQGREKESIILTTVDNEITDFTDDPYLLNVAISRARRKLDLVVSGNEQPTDSNIYDLISYIEYNNFSIEESKIYSVFDYLYSQYTESRKEFLKRYKKISTFDSENLMYALITDTIKELGLSSYGVVCRQPLNMLIRDPSLLNDRECEYAMNENTHLDFLLYNKVSKKPVLAIEVDGYSHHKEGTIQHERDKLKNHILALYNIPLLRFATNASGERETLIQKLKEII